MSRNNGNGNGSNSNSNSNNGGRAAPPDRHGLADLRALRQARVGDNATHDNRWPWLADLAIWRSGVRGAARAFCDA